MSVRTGKPFIQLTPKIRLYYRVKPTQWEIEEILKNLNMTENKSTKLKIKEFLESGKVLTSCTTAKEFITADLRKYISVLRSEGMVIKDQLVHNGNHKRFKKYYL